MTLSSDAATIELTLAIDPPHQDRVIAELDFLGFEAFLQEDHELRAYRPSGDWTPELDQSVRSVLGQLGLSVEPKTRVIAPENWNDQWERSVRPIVVGDFLIAPSWSRHEQAESDLVPIEIDPKMSFGTGYHATTRLMLQLAPSTIRARDRVLDAGTGTGILAIAAAKLGASYVLGFDIDPWSEENARENCERNAVADIVDIRLGDLDSILESAFDVILANIQLDVIIGMLPTLSAKLKHGGRMLLSGILEPQVDTLVGAAARNGLVVLESRREGEWSAVALRSA